MMFEVCKSRALNKTNWFLLAFLHASRLALVNLGEGSNRCKKIIATLIKETTLSLTLETGNKSLVRSIIFFIIRENKNSF